MARATGRGADGPEAERLLGELDDLLEAETFNDDVVQGLVHTHILDVVRRELGPIGADATAARLVLIYQGLLVLSRAGQLTTHHRDAILREFETLRSDIPRSDIPRKEKEQQT